MTCPLCSHHFADQAGCRGCGLLSNCALVRCPNCGYEFVERSRVVDFINRVVLRKGRKKTKEEPSWG